MTISKRVLGFAALFFTVSLMMVQTCAAQNANYPPAVQNMVNNLPVIQAQANAGNSQAQYTLALCYTNGWGVQQDLVESVKWVSKSAEQGFPPAQYDLGMAYANSIGGLPRDMVTSLTWVRKAADQGYPPAQLSIGQAYCAGIVISKDVEEGLKWVRKAADQGYLPAQCFLGQVYYAGIIVPKDLAEGVKWFRKAAEQGFPPAQNLLGQAYLYGNGVPQDLEEGAIWFRKAAEKGFPAAANTLGVCYDNGLGVSKDSTKASHWYKIAVQQYQIEANKGSVDALCGLAMSFYWGNGVEKDLQKAVNLFTLAAQRGQPGAQYNLSWCYYMGIGVEKNVAIANQWYQKAEQQGLTHQVIVADNLKLAEMGVAAVQYEHALRYLHGFGVKEDAEEAEKWLRKAAEQGYQPAIQELNKNMTTAPEPAPEPDPEPAPEPATEQTTQAPLPVIVPDVEKKPVSDNLDKNKKDEAAIRKFIKNRYGVAQPNQNITTFSIEIKDFKIISNNGKKATVQFLVEVDSGGYIFKPGEEGFFPGGLYDRHTSQSKYKVHLKKVKGKWTLDKELDIIADGFPLLKNGKPVPPSPAPYIPDDYPPYITPNYPY